MACRIEHHLDNTLDMTVCGLQSAEVHPEAPGDRRADLLGVELLAFDLAALENIGGQGLKDSFLLEPESQGFHMTDQPALPVTRGGERLGKLLRVPVKPRPVLQFMDIQCPHLMRRL